MSHVQGLVVLGVGGLIALVCRNIEVRQLRMDLKKLEWLEENVDQTHPPATAAERGALAAEIEEQQKALKLLWPRRQQRIQWEDLPMDKRFSDYFAH